MCIRDRDKELKILLASPRGFCAGVDRAIEIVKKTLLKYGSPVYVRHEIVHNKYVIEKLKQKGVIFIEDIDDVPKNSIIIFSAHGVSTEVKEKSEKRGLKIFDATCPLVTKVHLEVHKYASENRDVILIGQKNHPEIGRFKKLIYIFIAYNCIICELNPGSVPLTILISIKRKSLITNY